MGIDLIADLMAVDSTLGALRQTWDWFQDLITWMGGVPVALSALGVVLYVSLLWEQRSD